MAQSDKRYTEISVKNKMNYLESYSPFADSVKEFNDKVECIHCGNKFVLNEFKVVREMAYGKEYIVCKHYPECDGSIIDFVPVKRRRTKKG